MSRPSLESISSRPSLETVLKIVRRARTVASFRPCAASHVFLLFFHLCHVVYLRLVNENRHRTVEYVLIRCERKSLKSPESTEFLDLMGQHEFRQPMKTRRRFQSDERRALQETHYSFSVIDSRSIHHFGIFSISAGDLYMNTYAFAIV